MRRKIRVLRRKKGETESCWQTFLYDSEQENATVAPAVRVITLAGDEREKQPLFDRYREHFYLCCEEFRACEHVCPAELPLTQMMAYMNREMETAEQMGGRKDDGRTADGRNQ